MNRLVRLGGLLVLTASLAFAQTAPKPKAKKKVAAAPAEPVITAEDVKALKDALAAQQQQIEALKQEMQRRDETWSQSQQQLQRAQADAADAKAKAAAAEASEGQQQESVAKLSSDMADVKSNLTSAAVTAQGEQKRVSSIESALNRFRFTGDVRVRGESFFQQAAVDRNRARARVRFGFDGKLGESFVGGFAMATGSQGDPTTTNETFTNFFDRKTVALDRAYITFQPKSFKALQLTGGKFAYSWTRTPFTFDSDLNPEGFSEKLSWNLHSSFLKNFTMGAYQILFNEASAGNDSWASGGQFAASLAFGKHWTASPSFTLLRWMKADAILNSSAFAVGASPGEGPGCRTGSQIPAANCVFAPNGFTNATVTDAGGAPHFASGFFYGDFILNNTITTGLAKLPLNVQLEYLDNLAAASHPLGSTGTVIATLGSQGKAYGFDVSVGQAKNKNDIQVGYAWWRQEQDSAIASFNESDQRAPTNILQNKLYANWKIHPNVTASYTLWVGKTLNTNLQHAVRGPGVAIGSVDNNLKRMQFDLVYSF